MEQKWLILVLSVLAHLGLLFVFMPSYWDPVKRLGRRFSTLAVPFLVPAVLAAILLVGLYDHWSELPRWARIIGGVGVGATTATLTLNVTMLRALAGER